MNAHQYYQSRTKQVGSLGTEAYPHKWQVTISLPEFRERFDTLEVGQTAESEVSVAGRVSNLRNISKALSFYDRS